jgi:signal transduction histidine kinase
MSKESKIVSSRIWPWLATRLFPRGTNLIFWAAYVILIALLIIYVLDRPDGLDSFRYYSTLVAISVVLVINILWDDLVPLFTSEESGQWALLIISAGLAFYAVGVGRMFIAIYLIFMIAAQVNAMLPGAPAVAFSFLMAVSYMVVLLISGASPPEIQGTAVGLVIGMTFTITLSQVLRRYTEQTERANLLLEQLKQANTALIEARQKEKDLAVAEERVRMARDLHDGLGHHLTALSIQLQAAEKLLMTNPDLAKEAVRNARGEVSASLKEVRQSVAVLREAPVDVDNLPQTVMKLVEETGRLTGLNARFTQEGETANLSPAAAMTIYRAAQEGLTNVHKHASAARHVLVSLIYNSGEVRLSVLDDGKGSDQETNADKGGFGLAGLRERAHLLGGKIEHGQRREGGFQLEICLPNLLPDSEEAK